MAVAAAVLSAVRASDRGRSGVAGACTGTGVATGTISTTTGSRLIGRMTMPGSGCTQATGAGMLSGIISSPAASRLTASVPLVVRMRSGSRWGLEAGFSKAKPCE